MSTFTSTFLWLKWLKWRRHVAAWSCRLGVGDVSCRRRVHHLQCVSLPLEAHPSSGEPLKISPGRNTRLSQQRLLTSIFSDNGRGILPRKSFTLVSNFPTAPLLMCTGRYSWFGAVMCAMYLGWRAIRWESVRSGLRLSTDDKQSWMSTRVAFQLRCFQRSHGFTKPVPVVV